MLTHKETSSTNMSEAYDAEFTAEVLSFIINNYAIYGLSILVAYDHLLTLSQEIELFWSRRFTATSLLFFLNRYLLLSYTVMQFVFPSSATMPDLAVFLLCHRSHSILHTRAIFWAARICSLTVLEESGLHRDRLRPATSGGKHFLFQHDRGLPYLGSILWIHMYAGDVYIDQCKSHTLAAQFIRRSRSLTSIEVLLLSRVPMIASDVLVVVTLWTVLFRTSLRKWCLASIVLRDGSLYFLALLAMNIAQLVFNYVPALVPEMSPTAQALSYLSPILVSRLLLNMRQTALGSTETFLSTAVMSFNDDCSTTAFSRYSTGHGTDAA
ncbi:hypothetical protein NM688_g3188 [Phlebia brevispora]|uniref:Uncharacterized protein n=1 Tax=Phlebia brevispora TaxID=194682 RepID=A0ACC1T6D9_9APHY|nr:hypothetical protein NM688_g3188 [Phlebia brevispora]